MFEVARRFRQLKEKYITEITESQNEEKFVICKMDFLQPHLEYHSPTPNNQSSEFVFEFVDIPKETENTKRTAVEEDHPSKKKASLLQKILYGAAMVLVWARRCQT
jgi:hypothetical protein